MPSKPFLVFWYILSACALGTQRNILHHWASTQIKLSGMLNDMTIDQKSTKSPSLKLDTRKKRKSQAEANGEPRIILCTSREIPKKVHKIPRKKKGYRCFRALSIAKRPPNSYGKKKAPTRGITNTSMRFRSNKKQGKTPSPAQPCN